MLAYNVEMINRLRTAAGYQRQALRALFPESMGNHIEVIENEISAMMMESLMGVITGCTKSPEPTEAGSKSSGSEKVKKVDIG